MEKNVYSDMELKIIETARQIFVEKGYVGTSMSDIAAYAGINRPTLHYYYRTKDRMFQAVFGSIVERLVPRIIEYIKQRDLSVRERTLKVIDTYYGVFQQTPKLPLFIVREMNRDFDFMHDNLESIGFYKYFESIRSELQSQMDAGCIRQVPMQKLFLTFYSMLVMPFLAKPVCEAFAQADGKNFTDVLAIARDHIATVMESLLELS